MSNLESFENWKNKKVIDLMSRPPVEFTDAEMERQQIYSSLLFAITAYYFNGNKYGDNNQYPISPSDLISDAYYGHNIGALAVNKVGEIIDFEFNHNRLFNSSVEHAEARLIKRVFSLSQIDSTWGENTQGKNTQEQLKRYGNLLSDFSVYTTLESCTQCTGIMTLGDVKNIIYLQDDPGMYHIGNIVKNLTDGQGFIEAPLPVSGEEIGFSLYKELNDAFNEFKKQQETNEGTPFVIYPDGKKKYTSSITSFLCTNAAYNIFSKGLKQFMEFDVVNESYAPNEQAMNNLEVLSECMDFYKYATLKGKRGTPHGM